MSGQLNSSLPIQVDIRKFVSSSQRNITRMSNRLDDYLTSPDVKRIHDLRTAIRRLDVCCDTLPRIIREKRRIKKYVNKSKQVFRINSQIRDIDVITELIKKNNAVYRNNKNSEDPSKFENRRLSKLREAKIAARGLRKLPIPKIDIYKISSSKLTKRYNKLLHKFSKRIQLNLPLVLIEANNVNKLHDMRIDCKKLRYLLELLPHDKLSGNILFKLEEELQKMQDLLGAIHDCDAAVAFLKRQSKLQGRHDIIESVIQEREKRYHAFLVHCKSDTESNHTRSLLFHIPDVLVIFNKKKS
jgi:CHAD domain-containing protein